MQVIAFALFTFIILLVSGTIFVMSLRVKIKDTRDLLIIIVLLLIGFPLYWGVFIIMLELSMEALVTYYVVINIFGIFGNTLYKAYIREYKKPDNYSGFFKICMYLCILCDPFPIILFLMEILGL